MKLIKFKELLKCSSEDLHWNATNLISPDNHIGWRVESLSVKSSFDNLTNLSAAIRKIIHLQNYISLVNTAFAEYSFKEPSIISLIDIVNDGAERITVKGICENNDSLIVLTENLRLMLPFELPLKYPLDRRRIVKIKNTKTTKYIAIQVSIYQSAFANIHFGIRALHLYNE